MTEFKTLGLSETTLAALSAKGYTTATPIQAQSIPALLEGRDLLGIANIALADACDRTVLVVAGRAIDIARTGARA